MENIIILSSKYTNGTLSLNLEICEKYIGKKIDLSLQYGVYVKDYDPVHEFIQINSQSFIAQNTIQIDFNIGKLNNIYIGYKINIGYWIKLNINNTFLLFDKKQDIFLENILSNNPIYNIKNIKKEYNIYGNLTDSDKIQENISKNGILANTKELGKINFTNVDQYKIKDVFKSLGKFESSFITIMLLSIIAGATFYGGFAGFILGGIFGIIVVFVLLQFLGKRYIKMFFSCDSITDGMNLSDLITGKCAINTNDMNLEIVIYNYEAGAYMRGSGSSRRLVYFRENITKKMVYSKIIPQISVGDDMKKYLEGKLDMKDIFNYFLPNIEITKDYGVFTKIEVSIIHPKLIDIIIEKTFIIEKNLNYNNINKKETILDKAQNIQNIIQETPKYEFEIVEEKNEKEVSVKKDNNVLSDKNNDIFDVDIKKTFDKMGKKKSIFDDYKSVIKK